MSSYTSNPHHTYSSRSLAEASVVDSSFPFFFSGERSFSSPSSTFKVITVKTRKSSPLPPPPRPG